MSDQIALNRLPSSVPSYVLCQQREIPVIVAIYGTDKRDSPDGTGKLGHYNVRPIDPSTTSICQTPEPIIQSRSTLLSSIELHFVRNSSSFFPLHFHSGTTITVAEQFPLEGPYEVVCFLKSRSKAPVLCVSTPLSRTNDKN